MTNQYVEGRLRGLKDVLMGVYDSSRLLTSATKGNERETFIDSFLKDVLPPVYRFGSGDATDAAGNRSGQLDVVVEYPFAPSLPAVANSRTRLYLAECIAAVIEVKSDISNQWSEVVRTSKALSPLTRYFGTMMIMGSVPEENIPLFAVGYTGWKTIESLNDHVKSCEGLCGALIIESELYVSKVSGNKSGPFALWSLICDLHKITNSLSSASTSPEIYSNAISIPYHNFTE